MNRIGYAADVGGTTVKLGRFSENGELQYKWEIPTRAENDGQSILSDIAEAVKADRKTLPEDSQVIGMGVGIPGPVIGGRIVNRCGNMNWQKTVPVADILEDLLGIKVCVDNDANVAALGELWKGAAAGYKNVIVMTFGTGIGGALIINGKAIPGVHGAGGEIGHINVETEDPEECPCGRSGCVERYASASGLARQAKKYLALTDKDSVLRREEVITAREVWDAYREQDEAAQEIIAAFGDRVGRAMGAMACLADPELFVVGGGMSRAGEVLLDVLEKGYRKYCFHACMDTAIKMATLGNDAGIYGCMYMLMNQEL